MFLCALYFVSDYLLAAMHVSNRSIGALEQMMQRINCHS
jgi:hypothetical protein